MTIRIAAGLCFSVLALFAVSFAQEAPRGKSGQPGIGSAITHGPYTVYVLFRDVYRIEDANESNPAVTHNHGDHLGMLPAFTDDRKAGFWVPEAEFKKQG